MSTATPFDVDSMNALYEKGTYFDKDSAFHVQGYTLPGVEGELVPYVLRNDIVVTGIIFFSFLLLCYVLNRAHRLILHQIKDFFTKRERENLFYQETGTEFRYQVFLIAHAALMWGVLFFDTIFVTSNHLVTTPPWVPLLACVACCMVFYMLKYLLYSFVNWVFFPNINHNKWIETYSLLVSVQGIALFPVVCLSVYFNLLDEYVLITMAIILFLCKMLVFYKGFSIFFTKIHGLFYNILYFCTLELIPSLILIKVITEINIDWTIKF